MSLIRLTVNGVPREVDVEDTSTPLLYVLRNDLSLEGPRFGCGLSQCGACTVIIGGQAVRSCVRPVSTVQGAEVTTLEGLSRDGVLHPLQQAWIDEQVPQCGYCQNGQLLTAKALLDRNPNPTDAEIRQGMNGTLCRCMTYYRVQRAIRRAADAGRSAQSGPAAATPASTVPGGAVPAGTVPAGTVPASTPQIITPHASTAPTGTPTIIVNGDREVRA